MNPVAPVTKYCMASPLRAMMCFFEFHHHCRLGSAWQAITLNSRAM
jgi:hypothetical protein